LVIVAAGDALSELHALASLAKQIRAQLPRVIADARDQQHTWTRSPTNSAPAKPARCSTTQDEPDRGGRQPLEPD
jgi:hypothetical protein